MTTKIKSAVAAAGLAASLMMGGASPSLADEVTLRMAVPDWPPTRIMKKFFDEQYKPKSGNVVKLEVDFIPWPDFYTRVNASLTSGERKYNFIVSELAMAGRLCRGRLFPEGQRSPRCRSRVQEDVHGYPSKFSELLFDLSP